jgi:uncharacterized protein (TIGR03083 family)
MLSTERAIEAIRGNGLALADAAGANFDATIEACPGWDVADLVWHIRRVHYFWGSMVEGLFDHPDRVPEIGRPADQRQLLADYRAGVERMVDILERADQTAPVWTWSHQKDVAFVTRHQVQEAAVHRWDAEMAAGRRTAIEADVAADSVDEFLEHSTPGFYQDAALLSGSVHLHALDTEGEWTVVEGEYRVLSITKRHAPADASLSATASDLLLVLYRRIGIDPGQVGGDGAVLNRLVARTDLD